MIDVVTADSRRLQNHRAQRRVPARSRRREEERRPLRPRKLLGLPPRSVRPGAVLTNRILIACVLLPFFRTPPAFDVNARFGWNLNDVARLTRSWRSRALSFAGVCGCVVWCLLDFEGSPETIQNEPAELLGKEGNLNFGFFRSWGACCDWCGACLQATANTGW